MNQTPPALSLCLQTKDIHPHNHYTIVADLDDHTPCPHVQRYLRMRIQGTQEHPRQGRPYMHPHPPWPPLLFVHQTSTHVPEALLDNQAQRTKSLLAPLLVRLLYPPMQANSGQWTVHSSVFAPSRRASQCNALNL